MSEKLSFTGSGPSIALITFPYLVAVMWLDHSYPDYFSINAIPQPVALTAGAIVAVLGIIFYIWSVRHLLRGLKTTTLITDGPFALSRNPLYAAFFCFIIPAIAIGMRSWLVLTACLVFYIVFKITIVRECRELEAHFGDDYRRYCETTSELLPLPRRIK